MIKNNFLVLSKNTPSGTKTGYHRAKDSAVPTHDTQRFMYTRSFYNRISFSKALCTWPKILLNNNHVAFVIGNGDFNLYPRYH